MNEIDLAEKYLSPELCNQLRAIETHQQQLRADIASGRLVVKKDGRTLSVDEALKVFG